MIEVRLFATLRVGRDKICSFAPEDTATVKDILDKLHIPVTEAAILLINGFHSKPEDSVKDGDVVSIFPPVAGG